MSIIKAAGAGEVSTGFYGFEPTALSEWKILARCVCTTVQLREVKEKLLCLTGSKPEIWILGQFGQVGMGYLIFTIIISAQVVITQIILRLRRQVAL